jgi:hypothetical protein
MAGVGQADQPLVSAGASAQPLVTSPDLSITSSGAVQNLVDAMHNGFVTADDVVNRIGQTATAKKRALLEELGEYVSPEQIQARQAQAAQATAQAQLGTSQAASAKTLVPDQFIAAQNQTKLQQYNEADQEAIKAFGNFNRIPILKDKTYDYDSILDAGYDYKGAYQMWTIANKGLAMGPPIVTTDPKTGAQVSTYTNGFGEPRSPESVKYYTDLQRKSFNEAYSIRSQRAADNKSIPEPGAPNPPDVTATPSAPAPAAPVVPAPAPTTSAPAPATPLVTPNVPSAPLLANLPPDIAAASVQSGPGLGFTVKDAHDRLQNDKTYSNWKENIGPINHFNNIVGAYPGLEAKKMPTGPNDVELANTLLQLSMKGSSAGTRGAPEMRATNIEEAQYLVDKVLHLPATLLKKERFTEQTRNLLIQQGELAKKAIEDPAADAISTAVSNGVPSNWLGQYEQNLLSRYPKAGSASSATPAPGATASEIPSGVQRPGAPATDSGIRYFSKYPGVPYKPGPNGSWVRAQ